MPTEIRISKHNALYQANIQLEGLCRENLVFRWLLEDKGYTEHADVFVDGTKIESIAKRMPQPPKTA